MNLRTFRHSILAGFVGAIAQAFAIGEFALAQILLTLALATVAGLAIAVAINRGIGRALEADAAKNP